VSRTQRRDAEATRLNAEPLGLDGIASIGIFLLASLSLTNWLPPQRFTLPMHALWAATYVFAGVRILQLFGTEWVGWMLRRETALCALLALAGLSSIWSLDRLQSVLSAVSLTATTTLGVYIALMCSPARFMRVLYWTFAVLILSGIIVALLLPGRALPGGGIGWRGIMVHKNLFGEAAIAALIFFVVVTVKRCVRPALGAFLCVSALIALVGSRSRTAYGALAIGLGAAGYLLARRPNPKTWRAITAGLLVAGAVVPFFVGPISARLGHAVTFDGRTAIWAGALKIIRQRPLTGYGYMAVWGRREATLLPRIAITAHRSSKHAHNSAINIATELGIPAAVVSCVFMYGVVSKALRTVKGDSSVYSIVVISLLLAMIVMGFAEAVLLQSHSVFWILLVALSVGTTRSMDRTTTRIAARE